MAEYFEQVSSATLTHTSLSPDTLNRLLADLSIALVVCPGASADPNAVVTASLAANLLGRFYPRVHVEAPAPLRATLERTLKESNPRIELAPPKKSHRQVALVVGGGDTAIGDAVRASSSGWIGAVDRDLSRTARSGPPNPVGASISACLAAGEVFKSALRTGKPTSHREVSGLDFDGGGEDDELSGYAFRELTLFGVGAVGSAVVWLLQHLNLDGSRIVLVDPEAVDLSNLQRYILFSKADVGIEKVEKAQSALESAGATTVGYAVRLEQFADFRPKNIDLELCGVTVDNISGRRSAQALLPRVLVNGWTSDHGLGVSLHKIRDSDSACAACLYQGQEARNPIKVLARLLKLDEKVAAELWLKGKPPPASLLQDLVDAGNLEPELAQRVRGRPLPELYQPLVCGSRLLAETKASDTVAVPLAHQSALCGVLTAAALLSWDRRRPGVVSQWPDILGRVPSRWVQPTNGPASGCFCRDESYRGAIEDLWPT